MVIIPASRSNRPRFNSLIFSEEKIVEDAKVNQRVCIDESGQCLENIDQTHLVLASGKLVPQKE